MAETEVVEFLTYLAVERRVSASTHNQALSALLFLYDHVLERPLGRLCGLANVSRPRRLPTVLSRAETHALLGRLEGTAQLAAGILYGSGLRVTECLRLRVKDVDLEHRWVLVRAGKGNKDRHVPLAARLVEPLRLHP